MKTIHYSLTGEFSEPIPQSGKGVVIVMDSQLISTHQVTLPKMSNAKAHKAIPFAIESQLLDDIDVLQCHPIKSTLANTWDVLVVAKETILKIENELQKAKCNPVTILPDFLLLPFTKGKVSHIENDGLTTFRSDLYQGGCLKTTLFNQLFGEASLMKSSLSFDPQIKVNLQTNHASKGVQGYFLAWRLPVAIALVAILLSLTQIWAQNNQLEAQLAQYKTNNTQQFRSLFPEVGRIVNIRAQSKQGLETAIENNAHYQNDLLSKLALEVFPNSKANKITLKNQKLSVEILK